jgi:hypothetical protein
MLLVNSGEGSKKNRESKNKYLRHQIYIYIFIIYSALESLAFYGPCNSLERKPSISVVFASFWKWSLSPVRFLQDIEPRNRAFAGLDAAVSTAPATHQHLGVRIFDVRWLL